MTDSAHDNGAYVNQALPVTVKASRCASRDTLEWTLRIDGRVIASRFTSADCPIEHATLLLLQRASNAR
jgi:hypothetical protein